VWDWDVIDPEDRRSPDWREPRDTVIEFTEQNARRVEPGEKYYKADPGENPEYKEVIVGVEREIPDEQTRQFLRGEQRGHLHEKGKVLGVYQEQVDLTSGPDVNTELELSDEFLAANERSAVAWLSGSGEGGVSTSTEGGDPNGDTAAFDAGV
jgi:hypothetical protein